MTADYPAAKWMPADQSNYRTANRVGISLIVIHCTDGHASAENVGDMWSKPVLGNDGQPRPSSAHFCVGQDGTVVQAVQIASVAYHAHAANAYSVGVEHCARTPGEWGASDPGLPPSDDLYAASAKLVAWLCSGYGLQPSRTVIVGHSEADPTTSHTRCPSGCGWDWTRYIELVQAEYTAIAPAA